jgi:hypothetical protein
MKTIHIPFLKVLGLTGHLEITKAYLTGSTPFDKIKVIYIPLWPDRAPQAPLSGQGQGAQYEMILTLPGSPGVWPWSFKILGLT